MCNAKDALVALSASDATAWVTTAEDMKMLEAWDDSNLRMSLEM